MRGESLRLARLLLYIAGDGPVDIVNNSGLRGDHHLSGHSLVCLCPICTSRGILALRQVALGKDPGRRDNMKMGDVRIMSFGSHLEGLGSCSRTERGLGMGELFVSQCRGWWFDEAFVVQDKFGIFDMEGG